MTDNRHLQWVEWLRRVATDIMAAERFKGGAEDGDDSKTHVRMDRPWAEVHSSTLRDLADDLEGML